MDTPEDVTILFSNDGTLHDSTSYTGKWLQNGDNIQWHMMKEEQSTVEQLNQVV